MIVQIARVGFKCQISFEAITAVLVQA